MKIKYILLVIMSIHIMALSLDAQTVEKEFITELKKKNTDVKSIQCSFSQLSSISVLNDKVKKNGKFFFKYPDNFLLLFNDGDYIIMTNGWFEIKTSGQVNTTPIRKNPMLSSLSSLLTACISGDIGLLSQEFDMKISKPNLSEWEVVMLPKNKRLSSKLRQITLCFEKETMSLNRLVFMEKTGNYTEYIFSGKKFNVDIDKNLFSISKK